MANNQQLINIGSQPNDGTGDSIYTAFQKVNQNFTDVYSLLGFGASFSFLKLKEAPTSLTPGALLGVNQYGTKIQNVTLYASTGINLVTSATGFVISNSASSLKSDTSPTLAGDLNAGGTFNLVNIYPGAPVADYDATTKRWVYDHFVSRDGYVHTGTNNISSSTINENIELLQYPPTTSTHLVNKQYADTKIGLAGIDTIDEFTGMANSIFGTMTGALYLFRDPIETDHPSQAATKHYVDSSSFVSPVNYYVSLSGDDAQFNNPVYKRGRGPAYSFKTINRAAQAAEQFIAASQIILGPYKKTISYNNTINAATIGSVISSPVLDPTLFGVRITLLGVGVNGSDPYQNGSIFPGQYIIGDESEAVALIESINVDVSGNEIYDVVPVDYAKTYNVPIIPDSTNTVTTFTFMPSGLIEVQNFWVGYKFLISNGSGSTLSYGYITAVSDAVDGSGNLVNTITVDFSQGVGLQNSNTIDGDKWHVFAGDFQTNEQLQFGQLEQRNQCTIILESGDHEDQYPIRLAANVSVRGDEFRRCIIRPGVVQGTRKASISASKWVNVYFYRDTQIDGIITTQLNTATNYATSNTNITINSLTNDPVTGIVTVSLKDGSGNPITASGSLVGKVFVLGNGVLGNGVISSVNANTFSVIIAQNSNYNQQIENYTVGSTITSGHWYVYAPINYGYHYLRDASRPVNLLTTVTNYGGLNNAAGLLADNKTFIQDQVIAWIGHTYPGLNYTTATCHRDVGFIVDALVHDMQYGGNNWTINAGDQYKNVSVVQDTELSQTVASINYINTLGQQIIQNTTATVYNTSSHQIFDLTLTAEDVAPAVLTDLVQACSRIVNNDTAFNPSLYNDQLDVFLMNDSTMLRYLSGQGHGGFMKVLDPFGQIKAKSPYTQTASSFSKSYNRHVFSGGIFVDGFSGNILVTPASVSNDSNNNPVQVNITAQGGLGRPALTTSTSVMYEKPETPCFFVQNGVTYEVDFISNYSPMNGTGTLNLNPHRAGGIASVPSITASGFKTSAGNLTVPVRFGSPTQAGGLTSTGTAVLNASGSVTAINISFPGSGYINGTFSQSQTNCPVIIIGGARLSWTINNNGGISNYTIIDGGSGYAVNTQINFPQQGNGSVATAVVNGVDTNGAITSISITSAGSGYTTDPQVTFGTGLAYNVTTKPGFILTSQYTLPSQLTLVTAGNRSMLANDYTQINDLGYGIFVTNGGFMENVSMFTYYCHSSYYALNGAQVRTITGSTAYGQYGIISEGSDPTEVPISVRNKYAMSQIGTVNAIGTYTNTLNEATIYVGGLNYAPLSQSQLEINHNGVWKTYNIKSALQDAITSGVYNLSIDDGAGNGLYAAVPNGQKVIIRQYYDQELMDINASTLSRPSTVLTYNEDPTYVYRILQYTDQGGDTALAEGSTPYNYILLSPYIQGGLYRQGLGQITFTNTGSGYTPGAYITAVIPAPTYSSQTANVTTSSLATDLVSINSASGNIHIGTRITISGADPGGVPTYVVWVNSNQTQIRVSNATNWTSGNTLTFTNVQASGYGVADANGHISTLVLTEPGVGYDSTSPISVTFASGSAAATVHTTGIAGSKTIKVADLSSTNQARIAAGTVYTFGFEGDLYQITSYTPQSATGNAWAEVGVQRYSDSAALQYEVGNNALKAGIIGNQSGGITVRISTIRATSHDMIDVGTGGYADSKIPNDLYGPPLNAPDSSKQVIEIGKGRAYYVTTDQDGNFKVGNYFAVDQGRGTVSISAPISLTNVDGLSFKRGQTLVQVFSVDGTMGNESNNSVPTEKAIVTYVDSRLGLNKNNTTAGITPIGSGFLDLGGIRSMAADLNVNNYHIKNLASPVVGSDGANKSYTDTKVSRSGTNDPLGAGAGTISGPLKTNEISPNADNLYWLGTSSYRWSNIATINLSVDGTFKITSTANSTSPTTGALQVAGGVGVAKDIYTTGEITIANQNAHGGVGYAGMLTLINTAGTNANKYIRIDATGTLQFISSDYSTQLLALDDGGTLHIGAGGIEFSDTTTLTTQPVTSIAAGTGVSISGTGTGPYTGAVTIGIGQSVGTGDSPTFAGITIPSINKSGSTGSGDIGSSGSRFGTVWATTFSGTAVQAQYADLAEKYMPDREYEPGTVLVFGGEQEVTIANSYMDTRIAGVVSTNPAYMMNSEQDGGVYVALQGRVPCKVTGKIRKGDMLIAAGGLGVATASDNPKMGSVIGKALENYDSHDIGIIEVVVGRI
jgi:hypothetical protein